MPSRLARSRGRRGSSSSRCCCRGRPRRVGRTRSGLLAICGSGMWRPLGLETRCGWGRTDDLAHSLSEIGRKANDEVHRRHPVWTDDAGDGAHGRRFRAGFVAGAEWASTHLSLEIAQARSELALVQRELETALGLAEFSAAARTSPSTVASRDQLIQRIADIVDNAPWATWREGQPLVRNPDAAARELLNNIIAETVVNSDAGSVMFADQLPPGDSRPNQLIDWAAAKRSLIENEGSWGLVVQNISASTITQLRAGNYRQFRGHDLELFEFATRRPRNPEIAYPTGRSDLWGRYRSQRDQEE